MAGAENSGKECNVTTSTILLTASQYSDRMPATPHGLSEG